MKVIFSFLAAGPAGVQGDRLPGGVKMHSYLPLTFLQSLHSYQYFLILAVSKASK